MYTQEQSVKYLKAVDMKKDGASYASIARHFGVSNVTGSSYVRRGERILNARKLGFDKCCVPNVIISLVEEFGREGLKQKVLSGESFQLVGPCRMRILRNLLGLPEPKQKERVYKQLPQNIITFYVKSLERRGYKVIPPDNN